LLRTFEVNNIKCQGCINTIKSLLVKNDFTDISIDLSCEPRKVIVEIANEAQVAQLRLILRNLGYPFSNDKIKFSQAAALKTKSFVSCAVGKFSDTIENEIEFKEK
jgi:copper chaperone CopZ